MAQTIETPAIDLDSLRQAIRDEYALVADEPQQLLTRCSRARGVAEADLGGRTQSSLLRPDRGPPHLLRQQREFPTARRLKHASSPIR